MKILTVVLPQKLIDMCIQIYGDTQYLYQFAKDNGLEVDSNIKTGDTLIYDDTIGLSKVKTQTIIKGTDYFNAESVNNTDYLEDGIGTILTDGQGNPFPTAAI